jgi:DNA-binding CsgD family transcriptional regulator
MPAIRRTVALVETVMETRVTERLDTLADFGCPGFLLDGNGLVLRTNEAADQLLGSELWLSRGRLAANDRTLSRTLRELCRLPLGDSAAKHASCVLMRDGMPWMLAQIAELTSVARDVFCGGRRLLLLRPVAVNRRVDAGLLAIVFGLTPAEARLASELTGGPGLDAGCAALGIGRETGRTHLKSIFLKTNTSSQAELAALLNRLPPG